MQMLHRYSSEIFTLCDEDDNDSLLYYYMHPASMCTAFKLSIVMQNHVCFNMLRVTQVIDTFARFMEEERKFNKKSKASPWCSKS